MTENRHRDLKALANGVHVCILMDSDDIAAIYRRHGLSFHHTDQSPAIATVLGGLEAEIAAITAKAHAATDEYAALLWAERAEAAKLRMLIAEAAAVIEAGAALMTLEQLSEWNNHGAVLHMVGFAIDTR